MIKRKLALASVLLGIVAVTTSLVINNNRSPASGPPVLLGSIVRLVTEGHTFCSGTVVSHHVILTAAHCVSVQTPFGLMVAEGAISIRDNDNVERGVLATIAKIDPQTDHALLRGNFEQFAVKSLLTDPAKLTEIIEREAKPVFTTCGYPLGGNLYCTATKYKNRFIFYWAVQGTLLPGMSGGPTMINGQVVGTNYAVQEDFSIISPTYNVLENARDQETP